MSVARITKESLIFAAIITTPRWLPAGRQPFRAREVNFEVLNLKPRSSRAGGAKCAPIVVRAKGVLGCMHIIKTARAKEARQLHFSHQGSRNIAPTMTADKTNSMVGMARISISQTTA